MSYGITVCGPTGVRTVRDCVVCDDDRPMVGRYGHYYGTVLTCIGCGSVYDSEWDFMNPDPGARGTAEERMEEAAADWDDATDLHEEMRHQEEIYRG